MVPLGGRGWHPIFRAASPLPDVPIPLESSHDPPPQTHPNGSPTPTLSLTCKPLPVLPSPAQPPAASPPPIHLPSSPTDLCPSPTMHMPLLVAGGHAPRPCSRIPPPSPTPPPLFQGALQLAAPRAPPMPPPFPGRGRGALLLPWERWDPPPSRACLMVLGRRGLVPVESLASSPLHRETGPV